MIDSSNNNEEKFKCFSCSATYNVPIILPCGNTICLKCIEENDYIITCQACDKKHFLSPKNLTTNKLISELMRLENQEKKTSNVFFRQLSLTEPTMSNRRYTRQPSIWMPDAAAAADDEYENISDPKFREYLVDEVNKSLAEHLAKVDAKVNLINNALELGKQKIDDDTNAIARSIEDAAQALIKKIENQKCVMLDDVCAIKKELLNEYQEQKEFKELKDECQKIMTKVKADLQVIQHKRKSTDAYRPMVLLTEKLEYLNAKINDKRKVI
jgi:hypothetical protein